MSGLWIPFKTLPYPSSKEQERTSRRLPQHSFLPW